MEALHKKMLICLFKFMSDKLNLLKTNMLLLAENLASTFNRFNASQSLQNYLKNKKILQDLILNFRQLNSESVLSDIMPCFHIPTEFGVKIAPITTNSMLKHMKGCISAYTATSSAIKNGYMCLNLSGMNILYIPEALESFIPGCLKKITRLNLGNNNLLCLNAGFIEKLHNIKCLDLSNNRLGGSDFDVDLLIRTLSKVDFKKSTTKATVLLYKNRFTSEQKNAIQTSKSLSYLKFYFLG